MADRFRRLSRCGLALAAMGLSACAGGPPLQGTPEEIAAAIRGWNARTEPRPIVRLEAAAVPGVRSVYLARGEYEEGLFGFFGCYRIEDGEVVWQARVAEAPTEQAIYSARALRHPSFRGPLVEVIGRTPMGNGDLHLYELDGETLRPLLTTRAYDSNPDPFEFDGGVLKIAYSRVSEKLIPRVELTGVVNEYPEGGPADAKPLNSWPCRKAFVWHEGDRRFIPVSSTFPE